MQQPEFHLQCQVVQWLRSQYPAVKFNADCGGMRYGSGLQAILRGKRMKEAGHSAGYPDVFIAKAKWGLLNNKISKCPDFPIMVIKYCGLFIEFKAPNKKIDPSPEQVEWINYLLANGYAVSVCNDYDEAVKVITEYLK